MIKEEIASLDDMEEGRKNTNTSIHTAFKENMSFKTFLQEEAWSVLVLIRISIASMKHMTKASWGGKGLFSLCFHVTVHHQRKSGQELKQGRNLEAGADTEAKKRYCLLAWSPWLAQPAFLETPG